MTEHEVYWPEMGIEDGTDSEESDDSVREWTENPTLRKILLTIYIGSEVVRMACFGLIASGFLIGASRLGLELGSNSAIVWGFIATVALTMGLDEASKRLTDYSLRFGAFLASTVVLVSLIRLYLSLKERRNSIENPSALASSLPIESIPILELYKRRNKLM